MSPFDRAAAPSKCAPAPVDFGPDTLSIAEIADLYGLSKYTIHIYAITHKLFDKVESSKFVKGRMGALPNMYSAVSVARVARLRGWIARPTKSLFTPSMLEKAARDFVDTSAKIESHTARTPPANAEMFYRIKNSNPTLTAPSQPGTEDAKPKDCQ